MKITIISKSKKIWEIKELTKTAKNLDIAIEVKDIFNLNNLSQKVTSMGDVIIWRSATIDKNFGRNIFLRNAINQNKIIINHAYYRNPYIINKIFQQHLVKELPFINTIESYQFGSFKELLKTIKKKELRVPFIIKPAVGSRGKGVKLIQQVKDIDHLSKRISDYVFQNYIKNKGDFRVFTIGGIALGSIQRIAKSGSFLNNISQGGKAIAIKDNTVLKKLSFIASNIVSHLKLNLCGVDIIYNEIDKKYYFLEVNTVPQWQGFQKATGINVSRRIINYCQELYSRKKESTVKLVEDNYKNNFLSLSIHKQFHFASRMYLYNQDKSTIIVTLLKKYKKNNFGKNSLERIKILKNKLKENTENDLVNVNFYNLRKPLFDKYPKLRSYNFLLFCFLYHRNIYSENIQPIIKNFISDKNLINLRKKILSNPSDIAILSTHAINFLYISEIYLNLPKNEKVNPQFYLQVAKNHYMFKTKEDNCLLIYLYTHCIIGESQFYTKKISCNLDIYQSMLQQIEKIIYDNYFDLSLDIKYEYLVCAKLCNYQTKLKDIIISESKLSLSPIGNFIIDTLNNNKLSHKITFNELEHTNTLFLMAAKSIHDF